MSRARYIRYRWLLLVAAAGFGVYCAAWLIAGSERTGSGSERDAGAGGNREPDGYLDADGQWDAEYESVAVAPTVNRVEPAGGGFDADVVSHAGDDEDAGSNADADADTNADDYLDADVDADLEADVDGESDDDVDAEPYSCGQTLDCFRDSVDIEVGLICDVLADLCDPGLVPWEAFILCVGRECLDDCVESMEQCWECTTSSCAEEMAECRASEC